MSEEPQLARAYALLQSGQLADAEAICRAALAGAANNATALHLLGLIRRDAGDPVAGEQLLRESIAAEPSRAEFRANLANLLLRLGRLREAERGYREALGIEPGFLPARLGLARALNDLGEHAASEAESRVILAARPRDSHAWSALAAALRDQGRLADAEQAYRAAIDAEPGYVPAHANLGAMYSQADRAEEALERLEHAQKLGARGFELAVSRGRTLLSLYRLDEAEGALAAAAALKPLHAGVQSTLARLRFMRGDPDFARDLAAAVSSHPDETALTVQLATLLRRAGDASRAEAVLREALRRSEAVPELRAALAQVLQQTGRLKEAEKEALEAATASPGEAGIVETLVAVLLARAKPDDAWPFIEAQRARLPFDQSWIAWEATASRLLATARYRELSDYSKLVRSYKVEPAGRWPSIEELNAALLAALDARHPFVAHPLDESIQGGSRTVRSLLTERDAAIQGILKAFESPLAEYREAIGTDAGHPLTARNAGRARLIDAWSVRLGRGGLQLNQVHRRGWISATYCVGVPDEVADVKLVSGWLKFGEPRVPIPGAQPECFIKPQPGLLVLYPSYLWHGTNPLRGSVPCTTIGFGAVPVAA